MKCTYLGRLAPLTLFNRKLGTYCGKWTLLTSHSVVCSIVQLCTSDLSQASHNSLTEMCMSLSLWKALWRFSDPELYFSSSFKNYQDKNNVLNWTASVAINTMSGKIHKNLFVNIF